MNKIVKKGEIRKVRFPIGIKLIIIISIIVLFSLGSITALVSWLIRGDLQISAEDNNFETNRRSAMEAENTLENVRAHSRILINSLSGITPPNQSLDFFFKENPQIASVFFISQSTVNEQHFINREFFSSRNIDLILTNSFLNTIKTPLGRAIRGETLLMNAAPHFSAPLLALFFPWENGGAGFVLFSADDLNTNFGFGANKSFMVNSDGDILSHPDFSLVKEAKNISGVEFFSIITENPQHSSQTLLESDFGSLMPSSDGSSEITRQFMAFTKLNTAGVIVITSIEYNKVFEGIRATTRRNIYLTIAVLCISIIFIWFFSKTISAPLKILSAAAAQIESGNFKLDIQHKSNDEIGILSSSFNKMSGALNIFGRFTNKDIAVKAMRGEIKPGGTPKHATIFFSDIRSFTALSENFTNTFGDNASDKIVHWLNRYFTQMINCIEKTSGVVDKFIGDAVMAHWGAAHSAGSPEKDAYNCIFAALMMRKALYLLNKERKEGDASDPSITIGCGINTGVVTAGQLGSDMRMEYTVIGDPVNLASRIEALTKPLAADILVSEDTYNLVSDSFIAEEMPSVTVKGKAQPVKIFAIVNFKGIDRGPQSLKDVRSALGLKTPDLSKVDLDAGEKKYKIESNSK